MKKGKIVKVILSTTLLNYVLILFSILIWFVIVWVGIGWIKLEFQLIWFIMAISLMRIIIPNSAIIWEDKDIHNPRQK